MKGCNTLTLCPAQMHEAIEYWLKNQLLSGEHATRVSVYGVEKISAGSEPDRFEVHLREKAPVDTAKADGLRIDCNANHGR
jgi:hypothetical protein